ncbi:hypothetical protein EJ063_12855 [Vibrio aquaticus]|uniref:Type 4 fimbrial biogenesis protein PilX N-terminal domain-containing protein n=1 Tax=Vibrio aquaticus TaxID=2496559 RepID=A0A432CXX1_9VIBR|nr:hypothetical protein [Vibrio aquaticus]RTZ15343.1 hypothetical protein EJ063_12855 [Vibrio aquaticus]
MRKGQQQGVITLLVVSVLLASALMLTLSSYKSVFYQIKRSQNELRDRQAHWETEGGIECLYAYVSADPDRMATLSSASNTVLNTLCKDDLNLTELYTQAASGDRYTIRSKSATHDLSKQVLYASKTGFGAIQTTADLRIRGSADIAPDAPRTPSSGSEYECVAVRYKGLVTFETSTASDVLQTTDPMADGPFVGFSGSCSESHKTSNATSSDTTNNPTNFKEDYQKDASLDPFKNYFNKEKTSANIAAIKADYEVVALPTITDGHDCSDIINTRFTATNRKLWIEGHCIIDMPVTVYGPHSLVVENGIFAVNGSTVFEGSMYHMVDMALPAFSTANIANYWNDVSFKGVIQSFLGSKTVYFDNGAFHPKGGMIFDSEGAEVVLNGSYNLDYSSSNSLNNAPKELSWIAGSWYVD